ncbi:unnamed protein product, partial [Discosporangium mesarthrocarpum]
STATAGVTLAGSEDPFLAQLHARLVGTEHGLLESLGRRRALLSDFGRGAGSLGISEGDDLSSDLPSASAASLSASSLSPSVSNRRAPGRGLGTPGSVTPTPFGFTGRDSPQTRESQNQQELVQPAGPVLRSGLHTPLASVATLVQVSRGAETRGAGGGNTAQGLIEASDTDDTEAEKEKVMLLMRSLDEE